MTKIKKQKYIMELPGDRYIGWCFTLNGKIYGRYFKLRDGDKLIEPFMVDTENGQEQLGHRGSEVVKKILKLLSRSAERSIVKLVEKNEVGNTKN